MSRDAQNFTIIGARSQKVDGALCILDLVQTHNTARRALAFATTAHIETEGHVTEFREKLAGLSVRRKNSTQLI
jgi:hypothetical protein